jgi:hypothetical protein
MVGVNVNINRCVCVCALIFGYKTDIQEQDWEDELDAVTCKAGGHEVCGGP